MRPVGCSETTQMLRMLLENGDDDLLSHSMKCTALSWAAKCGVPRELRRLLGRHATATRDADSVYSRDLMITPIRELGRVTRMMVNSNQITLAVIIWHSGSIFPAEDSCAPQQAIS